MDAAEPESLADLDTETLRQRAFALAAQRHDVAFFWSIFRHLPHSGDAESLDASLGAVGATVTDALALWRELGGRGYGESEPLLRAAFMDYLVRHDPEYGAGVAVRPPDGGSGQDG